MVKIEPLLRIGKISKIVETELARYTSFFEQAYKDNLKHCEANKESFPRWSIISGYYAMHDVSKLLIAKVYRLKAEYKVHETTIEILNELIKDKEALKLIEDAYAEFQTLARDLFDAKKERVKVQYYTGTPFMNEKYKQRAEQFLRDVVLPYIDKIERLIKDDNQPI